MSCSKRRKPTGAAAWQAEAEASRRHSLACRSWPSRQKGGVWSRYHWRAGDKGGLGIAVARVAGDLFAPSYPCSDGGTRNFRKTDSLALRGMLTAIVGQA